MPKNIREIVGLTLKEAERKNDMTIRPLRIDGEDLCGTCDHKTDRINVETKNGVIVGIIGVG